MKTDADYLERYIELLEKHFPNVLLITSKELMTDIRAIDVAIKILMDVGYNQSDAEYNTLLSISPYLKKNGDTLCSNGQGTLPAFQNSFKKLNGEKEDE